MGQRLFKNIDFGNNYTVNLNKLFRWLINQNLCNNHYNIKKRCHFRFMRQFLWSIMKLFKSSIQNYNQRMKKWQNGDDLMSPTEPQLLKLGNNKTSISLWDCSSCWVGFVSTRNKLDFRFINKDLLYYLLVRTVPERSLWCGL